jgi:hypothetical protein
MQPEAATGWPRGRITRLRAWRKHTARLRQLQAEPATARICTFRREQRFSCGLTAVLARWLRSTCVPSRPRCWAAARRTEAICATAAPGKAHITRCSAPSPGPNRAALQHVQLGSAPPPPLHHLSISQPHPAVLSTARHRPLLVPPATRTAHGASSPTAGCGQDGGRSGVGAARLERPAADAVRAWVGLGGMCCWSPRACRLTHTADVVARVIDLEPSTALPLLAVSSAFHRAACRALYEGACAADKLAGQRSADPGHPLVQTSSSPTTSMSWRDRGVVARTRRWCDGPRSACGRLRMELAVCMR